MAKILLLTLGSRGDVQPYAALGRALRERGYDVTLSTSRGFEDFITNHGLTPAPLSLDIQEMMSAPEIRAAMTSARGWIRAIRMSQDLMQRQLDDMWQVAQDTAPDLIVYHPKAFVAPYLARALGAIAVPSFLQPAYVPTGAFAFPLLDAPSLGKFGNRLFGRTMIALMRLGYGTLLRRFLPRHPDIPRRPGLDALAGFHPDAKPVPRLHAHSAHLVPTPPDWGPDEHVTGYWFLPETHDWQPSADLAAFLAAGPPPVYIGFGSMPTIDAGQTAGTLHRALSQSGTRAIISKGWGALEGITGASDIHVIDHAPHDRLFPACRAVIHHGGAGTTHEGLRWGRPTLVCPVFGDQPFWGRRISEQGAGPEPLALKHLTEDRFRAVLDAVTSGRFDDRAVSLGDSIRAEGGATRAADILNAVLPV
ncbi:MAG: glycosyltransferase [Pseudomonadota bacterium]